jgi:hypothetical protein
LALLAWEELFNGCKEQLGLLFIIPDAAIQNHWYNCGLGGPYLNSDFLETIRNLPLPKQITDLFDANRDHVQSVLNRIKLAVISWKGLKGRLVSIEESLDLSRRGDQTLAKLIKGFLFQLEAHGDTGIR